MTVVAAPPAVVVPEQGNLFRVRDRYWVVKSVVASETPADPGDPVMHHAVELVPIDAEGSPDSLTVFWAVEPGTAVHPQTELPDPADGLDDAVTFGAFLDAVRWGAIASGDPSAFQAPFQAGIEIEDYQLLPLVKALEMPRVTVLIADVPSRITACVSPVETRSGPSRSRYHFPLELGAGNFGGVTRPMSILAPGHPAVDLESLASESGMSHDR